MTLRWKINWGIFSVVSLLLLGLSQAGVAKLGLTEVLGFITGAACVMLVVRQNIWNYPIGLANNLFFIILFWQARLYGDMGLQAVYVVLGIIGWYWWLHGGEHHSRLNVRRTGVVEATMLTVAGAALTFGFTLYFRSINDSAPFLDALTTALSLIAQWLLNGKRIENWFVWIAADVIYIYLYASKGLFLTSVLYAGFIGLCIAGLLAWRRALAETRPNPTVLTPAEETVA